MREYAINSEKGDIKIDAIEIKNGHKRVLWIESWITSKKHTTYKEWIMK